jgi:hypothetical protein
MGDNYVRGSAAKMIISLDALFKVCDVVKPGSVTKSLTETIKEVESLTMNGLLIICSRATNIDTDDSMNILKNTVKFINNVNHTNIILMSILYRNNIWILLLMD